MTLGDRASSLSEHLCLAGALIELGTASAWLTDCSAAQFQVPISTGGEREEGLPPSVTQAVERILKKTLDGAESRRWFANHSSNQGLMSRIHKGFQVNSHE